jgi:hypothetical protein
MFPQKVKKGKYRHSYEAKDLRLTSFEDFEKVSKIIKPIY